MTEDEDVFQATHVGQLTIGEAVIDCAVLEDGRRVLSQRGVGRALGRRHGGKDFRSDGEEDGGGKLPPFLGASNLNPFIPDDLVAVVTKPILYLHPQGGGVAYGLEANALPQVCEVWLRARREGELRKSQEHIAKQAEILMAGLATVGVIALVDEATGYQHERARRALEEILETFIAEEFRKWSKTFPDEFYRELFRLRGWPYEPSLLRKPGVVGHLTNDLVYERLAPGVLDELRKLNPAVKPGQRRQKHHQWLTDDVGHPKLREHLAAVIALMKASATWDRFYHSLQLAFPRLNTNLKLMLDWDAD